MSKSSHKITQETFQDEMDKFDVVMTPDAIPDLNIMSERILELLDFIESEDMKQREEIFSNEYAAILILEKNIEKDKKELDSTDVNASNYDKLLTKILESKRRIDKLMKLADKKKEEFENLIYGKFNSVLPMKIISLMIEPDREDNLTELLDMFEILKEVKEGKRDLNEEAEKFGEKNRSKYVYPKFGGKDKYMQAISNPNSVKPPNNIHKKNNPNLNSYLNFK